jgi:fructokinase
MKPYDIVVAGELLIDFITKDYVETLEDAHLFERFKGGSGANLSCNMALLGGKSALVATIGNDDMGKYLKNMVRKMPIDTTYLGVSDLPTTLILVTRTLDASDFQPYRGADTDIQPHQLPDELMSNTRLFHTTCFSLSLEPARTSILEAASKAVRFGATLSIDVNYRQKLWKDRIEAQKVIQEYISQGALVKCSEVDWEAIYEVPFESPEAAAQHFINMGAKAVSITLGTEGCYSINNQNEGGFLPARKVNVVDTTGAGDAFWSGFLSAWLDDKSPIECSIAGRKMAETKIGIAGQLSEELGRAFLYQ